MISCDFWPQLEQEMKTLAANSKMVLKVVISGSGGRGYSTLNSEPATRILSLRLILHITTVCVTRG